MLSTKIAGFQLVIVVHFIPFWTLLCQDTFKYETHVNFSCSHEKKDKKCKLPVYEQSSVARVSRAAGRTYMSAGKLRGWAGRHSAQVSHCGLLGRAGNFYCGLRGLRFSDATPKAPLNLLLSNMQAGGSERCRRWNVNGYFLIGQTRGRRGVFLLSGDMTQ